jgi:2-polyprenyl-3-methyl-5-hydroxy-6-metoxy-1,4-benzoquinol methylase
MDNVRRLLACPACGAGLSDEWTCDRCSARYDVHDGIPDLRLPGDARTETVRQFYERAPFPGYPPRDSLHALRLRAERSVFARQLDRAIPGNALVVEVGCGTGQMCLYLARSDRVIVGADLTRASLRLGAYAAARFKLDRVQFVETDLRHPGLKSGAFDVVFSSGVVHHTADPRASFARVAALAKPGGIVVIGVYNRLARMPTHLRRIAARISRFRVVPFDPVLRDRESDTARREAWFRDQYQHPEEHSHTIAEVQQWFSENQIEYLRTYPSALLEDDDECDSLFTPAADNWRAEGWLAQIGWIRTLGREGGLFFTIGRRSGVRG